MAALMGTLPIAMGMGAGAESRRPLGLAVVGGLLFSQILTLYVTPVFYIVFDNFQRRFGPKRRRQPGEEPRGPKAGPAPRPRPAPGSAPRAAPLEHRHGALSPGSGRAAGNRSARRAPCGASSALRRRVASRARGATESREKPARPGRPRCAPGSFRDSRSTRA